MFVGNEICLGSSRWQERQHIPVHVHIMWCLCVCLYASLLKGCYVLMRCKWLQEVVSPSLNGMPLHLWSPDFGSLGVVIVMLPHPPDHLWRIGFEQSIDRHVAASLSFSSSSPPPSLPPSHSILPWAFSQVSLKKLDRLPHRVPQWKSIVLSMKMSSPSGIKADLFCDNVCKILYI